MVESFTVETDQVRFSVNGQLGLIELNRPKAINALTLDMVSAMYAQLAKWESDERVQRVAVIGSGERGLCAGGDVRAVRDDIVSGNLERPEEFWRTEYALNAQIADYPKPYVAFMDGVVMGGGIGISAHGSVRLVTERTKIAMPETIIGLFPDVGATWLLARAPHHFGIHMALTGATIDGPTAVAVGLADALIDSTDIPQILDLLSRGEPIDEHYREVAPVDFGSWLEAYAADDAATIVERLRASDDPAAQQAADDIGHRSPFSVAVTLEAIRRAGRMESLPQVLAQDLVLGRAFLQEPDFSEGVRAQLVDKDRSPRWRHGSVAEVDTAEVVAAFTP